MAASLCTLFYFEGQLIMLTPVGKKTLPIQDIMARTAAVRLGLR